MNGFKDHDSFDVWSYTNWDPNFTQQELSEQSVSKDFIVDPCAIGKHSKIASKMEIRRSKDRIRKRILRARETPLASAIRREKNRRRMAAARASKSMQKKIFQCVQENNINPEMVAEVRRLNRMTYDLPEAVPDSLSQSNLVFNRDKLPNECASVNHPLVQPQHLYPNELQVSKNNQKKTQTSEMISIILDDDKKIEGTIGEATFHKKTQRTKNRMQASSNVHILDEDISEIQILTKSSANPTAIAPTIRRGKNKMAANCMPLEVTITNRSLNRDNIGVYPSSDIQTERTTQPFGTTLLSSSQNQPKRDRRENSRKTAVSVKNSNVIPSSDMVAISNLSEEMNCMSARNRQNISLSIEMRRKRDRLRKQLARARESQFEKELRQEKNRRRMAEFRSRHRLKARRAQMEPEYKVATAASWNQTLDQQWTLNEVTPPDEQNNASNLRTHPPEPSFLLPKERRTFVVPNHLESFMSNLSSLWKAGRLCDASISNGTADIMIHKMVLATVCPKILTELSKTPLDKFQKVTFPNTVSKEALTAFAEYMYSGVLDLDETILAQLKIIAQRLDMREFEQLCENHLQMSQLALGMDPAAAVGNELQSTTDFESMVGTRTQTTFRDDLAPIMKLIPVDGYNSDVWPSSSTDISFPITSCAPSEGMLKIKQELADSAISDNIKKPLVKKEPVTLENKVLGHSSAWENLDLLRDKSTQPQGSLPHVESLVSISPLCTTKMTNPNAATNSVNFSTTTACSSRPTAPNITPHGNPISSSSFPYSTSSTSANTAYSQTDNSQVNLLSGYASRTSEAEAALTTAAAAIASLTSNTDNNTSQTLSMKLPSPLSFYNIT